MSLKCYSDEKILVYANRRVIHQWDSQYQKGAILNLPSMK